MTVNGLGRSLLRRLGVTSSQTGVGSKLTPPSTDTNTSKKDSAWSSLAVHVMV